MLFYINTIHERQLEFVIHYIKYMNICFEAIREIISELKRVTLKHLFITNFWYFTNWKTVILLPNRRNKTMRTLQSVMLTNNKMKKVVPKISAVYFSRNISVMYQSSILLLHSHQQQVHEIARGLTMLSASDHSHWTQIMSCYGFVFHCFVILADFIPENSY